MIFCLYSTLMKSQPTPPINNARDDGVCIRTVYGTASVPSPLRMCAIDCLRSAESSPPPTLSLGFPKGDTQPGSGTPFGPTLGQGEKKEEGAAVSPWPLEETLPWIAMGKVFSKGQLEQSPRESAVGLAKEVQ